MKETVNGVEWSGMEMWQLKNAKINFDTEKQTINFWSLRLPFRGLPVMSQ